MNLGVGLDVVDLTLFAEQLSDPASAFVEKTFSAAEIAYAESVEGSLRVTRFGVRYAAREAFLKAWSSLRAGLEPAVTTFPYHLVEVQRDAFGRPTLRLSGTVERRFEDDGGGQILVSLSHDGGVASAVVIIQRVAPPPAA